MSTQLEDSLARLSERQGKRIQELEQEIGNYKTQGDVMRKRRIDNGMITEKVPMRYSKPELPFGTWDIQVEGAEDDNGVITDIEGVYIGIKKRNGMFREIAQLTGGRNLADYSDVDNCEPGNVRLILAAPLMYRALKMLLKGHSESENVFIGTMAIAKKAIKAAEEYELPYVVK